MSKQSVNDFLSKGGEDKEFREKYDESFSMEDFVKAAVADGFDFTVAELKEVLNKNGDSFESNGNPPKKDIWY